MVNIEYHADLDEKYYKIIDTEFNKFANKNDVVCNYTPFAFVAMEDNKFIGIITGNSYYKEIHISDLIVLEEYRNKKIGTKLVKAIALIMGVAVIVLNILNQITIYISK